MPKSFPKHCEIIALGRKSDDMFDTDALGIAASKAICDTQGIATTYTLSLKQTLIPTAWCELIPNESCYAARAADFQPFRLVAARSTLPPIFRHKVTRRTHPS